MWIQNTKADRNSKKSSPHCWSLHGGRRLSILCDQNLISFLTSGLVMRERIHEHIDSPLVAAVMLAILLVAAQVSAQVVQPRFEHITPALGLSNERVYTIAQTPDGAMWFGTYHGLNRYDGYTITPFTTQLYDDPATPLKIVNRIVADVNGHLWILSRNRFLRFDLATQRFTTIQRDTSGKFDESGFYYRGLAIDSTGKIWFGALDRLQRFDPRDSSFAEFRKDTTHAGALQADRILDITVDRGGRVWVLAYGKKSSLFRADVRSGSFESYPIDHTPTVVAERAILADTSGRLWIGGSPDGVIAFDPASGRSTVHRIPMRNGGSHVLSMTVDGGSRLWFGGWAGLHAYDIATGQVTSYFENKHDPLALQIDMISAVFVDRSGNLWLGVWGGGVDVVKARQKKFGHIGVAEHPEDKSEWVTAIEGLADGRKAIGTGRGLFLWDPVTGGFAHHAFHPDDQSLRYGKNHVTDIKERPDGKIWIGTYQAGLILFDPRTGAMTSYRHDPANAGSICDDSPTHLLLDRDGDLWIGGRTQGLSLLRSGARSFRRFQHVVGDSTTLPTNRVWRPYQDRQGRIWVLLQGSGAALCTIDKVIGKVSRVLFDSLHPESSRFQFRHIQEMADGTFWLGGEDNGLVHFDPSTGHYEQFTEREGMPYAYMGGFLHDGKGVIWFVSPKGLSRFSIHERRFETFEQGTDILEESYSTGAFYRAPDGSMYFGGRGGITFFHPDSIRLNSTVPETRIVDFQVFGRSVDLARPIALIDEVVLDHGENFFSFGFVGLDYTDTRRNRFMFMMDGVDRGWVEAGTRRYASYTNLDPGTYTFHVRSSNNDGVWDPVGASVRVSVRPAWWQTWWFRVLLLLTVAAGVYGFDRYRVNRLLEVERTRTAIASDLHDDIGTTLTSIALFSDLAKAEVATNAPQAIERLDRIASSSRELLGQMSDIVWSVKPDNDSLQSAILRMADVAGVLCAAKGIEYTIHVPDRIDEAHLTMQQRRNILLVFKEMVNNVLKHSRATRVIIDLTLTGPPTAATELRCSVRDNGVGFDPGAVGKGNGLRNMQTRAAAIGGVFAIHSSPGEGAFLELVVPVKSPR